MLDDLLLARRGTAYFSRVLGRLSDADLEEPSLVDGWRRRHVVAHVGYHARALARAVEELRTGSPAPSAEADEAREVEVDLGASLPAVALRHLHAHAAVHLDVEWRDLDADRWGDVLTLGDGRQVPVARTPRERAEVVWLGALRLGSGARAVDLPPEIAQRASTSFSA
ncbi:maleylpyruvate isomerase N-terminal domain-containing protein [Sediminihabitans luteus]|uniref:maleylpyruvate isomerase N-terminal domain-containing protein n=1 Tax=Sediminihabitans luteus TaxID=1138585 RepID=UPI001EF2C63B|nr:maleylpyruvate isomerase N-terminal domain-containing protein [Sediminihabitans luteus]